MIYEEILADLSMTILWMGKSLRAAFLDTTSRAVGTPYPALPRHQKYVFTTQRS